MSPKPQYRWRDILLMDQSSTSDLCNCGYIDRPCSLSWMPRVYSPKCIITAACEAFSATERSIKLTQTTKQHRWYISACAAFVCFCEEWQPLAIKRSTLNYSAHVKSRYRTQEVSCTRRQSSRYSDEIRGAIKFGKLRWRFHATRFSLNF